MRPVLAPQLQLAFVMDEGREGHVRGAGMKAGWIPATCAAVVALWLLRNFLEPLLWALILGLATWPRYRRFSARLPRWVGPSGRALLFTGAVTALVLGPFSAAVAVIAREAESWGRGVLAAEDHGLRAPEWLERTPMAGGWLLDRWNAVLGTGGGVGLWLRSEETSRLVPWVESLGRVVVHHAVVACFAMLALYFLYRGGEPLAERIERLCSFLGRRGVVYLHLAAETARATLTGAIVVALLDGSLFGIGSVLAGVPSPHVWAAAMAAVAPIPFVPYAVALGAAWALVAHGHSAAGTALACWGLVVIFGADKLVRPAIVGPSTQLGFFWVLVGTLAGLETFGLVGIFVGPIVLRLVGAIWHDLLRQGDARQVAA